MDRMNGKGAAELFSDNPATQEPKAHPCLDAVQHNATEQPKEPASSNVRLDWALRYAEKGWFVFPGKKDAKRGKLPRVRWGKGLSEYVPGVPLNDFAATQDPNLIRAWWKTWPDAEIGVDTGRSSLIVLDVDMKNGKNGEEALRFWMDLYTLPPTLEQVTPSGGRQLFFKAEELCRSITGADGLDVRSRGGMVFVPSGSKDRTWKDENTPVSAAPDWLPQAFSPRARTSTGETSALPGLWTTEDLEEALDQLNVEKFSDEEAWRNLMMAAHQATNGEGEEAFVDWSVGDPDYADQEHTIRDRWHSLNAGRAGGITYKLIFQKLNDPSFRSDRYEPDWQPRCERPVLPENDFDALPAEVGGSATRILRTKDGIPKNTFSNCLHLLRISNLGLAFNEFSQRYVLTASRLPWARDMGRELTDDMIRVIRHYLLVQYQLEASKDNVFEAAFTLARENPFHPVRDYLSGLKWDGISRLDGLLSTYFGAEDTPYTRAVGSKTLIAAVRRVRQPGCKFDTITILEGAQGTFKSSGIRALSPEPAWFSDAEFNRVESKDAVLSMQGVWIIELGEMSVLGASEVESLKAFASRQVDRIRAPYARITEDLPRQCIFIGSTNRSGYLRDQTGNRRFLPICTGTINLDGIVEDRDQLWAEAAHREANGEALELPQDVWAAAAEHQEDRLVEDPWVDLIRAFLEGQDEGGTITSPIDRVFTATLLEYALRLEPGRQAQVSSKRLREVMEQRLGYKYTKNLRIDSKKGAGYEKV